MAESLRLLRPTVGVVTTVGRDHFESYRSLEATAREKGQLLERLPRSGVAILNADNPYVLARRTERAPGY
jgi:UDP-N-acetylmuramoyl-tripeptide--D-alanyl-D-alanine ligase